MQYIDKVIKLIVSILESKFNKSKVSISKFNTIDELKAKNKIIQDENDKLIKKSNFWNTVFRIIASVQFFVLIKIIIISDMITNQGIQIEIKSLFMYRMYLFSVFIILFSSMLSNAIYSKSIKNLINSNPQVLNNIINNDYKETYGDDHGDKDLDDINNICQMFSDQSDNKQDAVYILVHSILINKAMKNFNVSVISASIAIATLDLVFIAIIMTKISLL